MQEAQPIHNPLWRSPTGEEIREVRLKAGRTQSQLAQILRVSERQFQRWEAGEQQMPPGMWLRITMTSGQRFPADFQVIVGGLTRSWDPGRDIKRDSIVNGDRVNLQSIQHGTVIQARVWLDRIHDGLIDDNSYRGQVIDFPGAPEAGPEFGGFYIGEHVTFSIRNVSHVEQRMPPAAK